MKSLLLGCGNSRDKRIPTFGAEWGQLTTLDIYPCGDITHDLMTFPYPLESGFSEIHAYEVLEHLWYQGDYQGFFAFFSEIDRLLIDSGVFVLSVPNAGSVWAIGDPGHRSIVTAEQLSFLNQRHYEQIGTTSCSDYRRLWKGDLRLVLKSEQEYITFFVLQKCSHSG